MLRRKNSRRMCLNESHGLRTRKAKKYTRLIKESGDFGLDAKEGISNSEVSEVAQNFLNSCDLEFTDDRVICDPYKAIIFDPNTQTFSVMDEEDAQGDDIICLTSSDLAASIDDGKIWDDASICDKIVDEIYNALYNELGPDYDFSDPRDIPDDVETEEIDAEIDDIEPDYDDDELDYEDGDIDEIVIAPLSGSHDHLSTKDDDELNYEGGDIDIEKIVSAPLSDNHDHLSTKTGDYMRLESVRISNRKKMLRESKDCEYFALKQARGVKKLW